MSETNLQTISDVSARISRLFVYPVKSCAGIEVSAAVLTETGLALDRAWMVVDAQGEFVTQREMPRLALVRPALEGARLILRAPGMSELDVMPDPGAVRATVKVWNDVVPAFDMGEAAAQWFTDFLTFDNTDLPQAVSLRYRLVGFDPVCRRLSSLMWTQGVEAANQFSDGFPLLVVSEASIDALNDKLLSAGHRAVGIERFRPNVVLSGIESHDEDRFDRMQLDADGVAVLLKPVKPCPRCPIPNVDPATALSSPEVGDMLQGYRQDARVGGAVTFGMNVIVLGGVSAVLRVGQGLNADFAFG